MRASLLVGCLCLFAGFAGVGGVVGGALAAPRPPSEVAAGVLARIAEVGRPGEVLGVVTDRPLYRSGETVWFRTWRLVGAGRVMGAEGGEGQGPGAGAGSGVLVARLVDGEGQVVVESRFAEVDGAGIGQLDLTGRAGGAYTLEVVAGRAVGQRPLVVDDGKPPALKMRLRFLRPSHAPGDRVVAAVEVLERDGSAVVGTVVAGQVLLDGAAGPRVEGTTDEAGQVTLRFRLPAAAVESARLMVQVSVDGVVSSVGRSVPLTPAKPLVRLLPEGGKAVVGLAGRVYVSAEQAGRPVGFGGQVVDDRGGVLGRVESVIDGRARFALTPGAGRKYRLVLDSGGQSEWLEGAGEGCGLAAVDDAVDAEKVIGVEVRCRPARAVVVASSRAGEVFEAVEVDAGEGATRVALADGGRQGAVTVTVLGVDGLPLAERVVFRRRNRGLSVEVKPDRVRAAPRDEVRLGITTRSAAGRPVAADVAVAVVDDAVLAHADDRSADLVAQVLLLPVVGAPIDRPGRYLAVGAAGGEALDLLMGTAGYRRFGWLGAGYAEDGDGDGIGGVIDACPGEPEVFNGAADEDGCPDGPRRWSRRRSLPVGRSALPVVPARVVVVESQIRVVESVRFMPGRAVIEKQSLPLIEQMAVVIREHPELRLIRIEGHTDERGSVKQNQVLSQARAEAVRKALVARGVEAGRLEAVGLGASRPRAVPGDEAGQAMNRRVELHIVERGEVGGGLVPVRVFPPPPAPSGDVRSDFRETVAWVPQVRTDGQGRASVTVRLSDALTGFRAVVQGVGRGSVGQGEALVSTVRPLMVEVEPPAWLVVGDRLVLPVTVRNDTGKVLAAELKVTAEGVVVEEVPVLGSLGVGERVTVRLPVVASAVGEGRLLVVVEGDGWRDAVEHGVVVAPRGRAVSLGRAGRLLPGVASEVVFEVPAGAEEVVGSLRLFPSAASELAAGLASLMQRPAGCFEQVTARHLPNVWIARLLATSGHLDPSRAASTARLLAEGAEQLLAFEVAGGGFSMYGQAPASPALTAYAVVQLTATAVDSPIDPQVVRRAVSWLAAHREPDGPVARRAAESAWIDRALALAGRPTDVSAALDRAAAAVGQAHDPYLLAVRALTLADGERWAAARVAAVRLAAVQRPDGGFPAVGPSFTGSQGEGLEAETAGLAARAFMRVGGHSAQYERAMGRVLALRRGAAWATTQATAQALAALVERAMRSASAGRGEVAATLDGDSIGRVAWSASSGQAVEIALPPLVPGRHVLALAADGSEGLPWSLAVGWQEVRPVVGAPPWLALTTVLGRERLKLGEGTTLTATVRNPGRVEVGDPLVRIGLPAGLEVDREQLEGWVRSGRLAAWERRPGELVLFLGQLAGGASVEFAVEVSARYAGQFVGGASSVYPYYAPDPGWSDPLAVTVR